MIPVHDRSDEGLRLAEMAREIPGQVDIVGDPEVRVYGVRHDSRRVEPGDLFVARHGAHADGTRFIPQAEERGAAAIMVERRHVDADAGSIANVPHILVDDAADALAFASAAVYGHPTFTLDVVGITGTNGKTTTSHLVRAAIDGVCGREGQPACGMIGTVGHIFGDTKIVAEHTTPEADELARVMAGMRRMGATYVAMEVSSVALSLGRVRAVRFRVAAFTNFTQDHLDFHGTMEAYAAAKESLFLEMGPGSAVVHVDDPLGQRIAQKVRAPLLRVSARADATVHEAEIAPLEATLSARGIDALLRTPRGTHRVRSRLVGRHNLENIVVAVGVACALQLDMERACAAIGEECGVPGRLERCDGEADDVTVLVDYAHTPDALARVLESVRVVSQGRRLLCVFGCGGDRDPVKRGPMGKAAAEGSDVPIITSDNPRTEDPADIARPVEDAVRATGLARAENLHAIGEGARGYLVELDRAVAIRAAVLGARPGDIVIIAGKGHEDYQVIGTEKRPFDDRIEARRALAERRGGV
ncbi:UDP-N-acetylmuramoyl-L-alanyl-D-glutamate--2,6-diaminopimelate ligase [Pendulispora albinea]|uniref:UDP-N-acetylmuramoyl-L-alanyl-D-glutamate--2,6-diaminopimelate ligase n=1 Tax=Pendulispora albinea TaxID=2741071 RepID=A0ABZ2M3Z7_9BACT